MMNTREEAVEKFNAFFDGVDTAIITDSAKAEFKKAPTQWHRLVEVMLLAETDKLEEKDARPMFKRQFATIHEKISMKTSLLSFTEWMAEQNLQIDANENGQLVLVPGDGKDRYDALDAFGDKFFY